VGAASSAGRDYLSMPGPDDLIEPDPLPQQPIKPEPHSNTHKVYANIQKARIPGRNEHLDALHQYPICASNQHSQ